jgi:hypothetical protein
LTTLAPHQSVGQTVSTHPSFAWFVPEPQPTPLEFQLYEYSASGERQLVYKTELQSNPGIMTLSLPKEHPGLAVGHSYYWQVILFCNPNRPSTALVAHAEIEVVNQLPSLQTALSETSNLMEQVNLYAEAGLWYDAFGLALSLPEGTSARTLQLSLLESLVNLEQTVTLNNGEQSLTLRAIVEVEQQKEP